MDAYRFPSLVVVLPLWVRSCVRITVISSSHDDEKLQCSVALGLQGRRCWAILVRKDACCSSEYAFVMVSSAQRERRSADMGVSRDLRALFILKEVQKRCQKSIGKFGLIRGLSCPINGVFKTVMHAHSGASSPVALDLSPLPQNVFARIHRGTHLPHVQGAQHHTSPWSDRQPEVFRRQPDRQSFHFWCRARKHIVKPSMSGLMNKHIVKHITNTSFECGHQLKLGTRLSPD